MCESALHITIDVACWRCLGAAVIQKTLESLNDDTKNDLSSLFGRVSDGLEMHHPEIFNLIFHILNDITKILAS